ncbi:MAG: Maf family protein [Phycisphaerae bacterium]|nr:Maf family protein [Phycisphaerae bacterium]MDW8262892.1 Maf family protein [Phycisphaerales bacterium]
MSLSDATPSLVLASASPRRRELLLQAGFEFEVHPADIDEDDFPANILPADLATALARRKAEAVAARFPECVVLGADTVVAFGDTILGKPRDAADAKRMLTLLAGTTHVVITGVSVIHRLGGFERTIRVLSAVHMRPLTNSEIAAYVASGAWEGKAGGYGIQDRDPFVRKVGGDYTNVVGLPMKATIKLLAEAGVTPRRKDEPSGKL